MDSGVSSLADMSFFFFALILCHSCIIHLQRCSVFLCVLSGCDEERVGVLLLLFLFLNASFSGIRSDVAYFCLRQCNRMGWLPAPVLQESR